MSDELQKIGYDANRTLIEAGNVVREPTYNYGAYEMILKYNITQYHFPSEERLKFYDGVKHTSAESITSGSQLIGVDDSNFNYFTGLSGGTDLQTLLDLIDAAFSNLPNISNVILKDGSVDMEDDWNSQADITVNNPSGHVQPKDFGVLGDVVIADSNNAGANIINNGSFTSGTNWTAANDVSVVNDGTYGWVAKYTYSSGSGTVKQSTSVFSQLMLDNVWYMIEYDIKTNVGAVGLVMSDTNTTLNETLDSTVGDNKVHIFKTANGIYGTNDLIFTFTGDSGDSCILDNVSLHKIDVGDLEVSGDAVTLRVKGLFKTSREIISVTSDTITYEDDHIAANSNVGDLTLTLPTTYGRLGKVLHITKTTASNNVIITGGSINGSPSKTLTANFESVTIIHHDAGTGWDILSYFNGTDF